MEKFGEEKFSLKSFLISCSKDKVLMNFLFLSIFIFVFWDYLITVRNWFYALSWWIKGPVIYFLLLGIFLFWFTKLPRDEKYSKSS